MDKKHCECCEPASLSHKNFIGIAHNGNHYLLLDHMKLSIHKYDNSFRYMETIMLKRKYTSICYDVDEQCYFALADNDASKIFKLDEGLNELDILDMGNAAEIRADNIYYDLYRERFWVSNFTFIGFAEKKNREYTWIKEELTNDADEVFRKIVVLPRCILAVLPGDEKDTIRSILSTEGEKAELDMPEGYRVGGMCAVCSGHGRIDAENTICILLIKVADQTSWVVQCKVTYLQEDHSGRITMCVDEEFLPGHRESGSCDFQQPQPDSDCSDSCEMDTCCPDPCEEDLICADPCEAETCCPDPCRPEHDCCDGHCGDSCVKEVCQIIHSIALEETGISHILNAEGEKIQKAISCCTSTKELLQVNESVRNTITYVIQLEIQLNLKLESALREISDKKCCSKCCRKCMED